MKIHSAEFILSAASPWQFPVPSLPEIAFAGRSNVGKSSLLRTILGQRKLIRVSSTPGCTRTINFYLVNEHYIFTDLPGYGFAKVSAKLRAKWGQVIETYLAKRQTLRGVVLLIDARHGPTANDLQLWEWLCYYHRPSIVVLTKADKLKQSERPKALKITQTKLGLPSTAELILFSARTGEGKKELWKKINAFLSGSL